MIPREKDNPANRIIGVFSARRLIENKCRMGAQFMMCVAGEGDHI